MPGRHHHRQRVTWRIITGGCLALIALACDRGTPAPPFRDPMAATPAQWEAYLARLTFDSVSLTTDTVRYRTGTRDGVVYLTSASGVTRLSDAAVARGRIIGRADTRDTVGFLGAPLGISYIWVDSLGGDWRWLWIADGRVAGPPQAMARGTLLFDRTSRSGMTASLDSFPNGRCGTRCCLWFDNLATMKNVAVRTRRFEDVHRMAAVRR